MLSAAQESLNHLWGHSPTAPDACGTAPECGLAPSATPPPTSPLAASSTKPTAFRAFDPPPLIGASMAYDAGDGYVVLFGGRYESGAPSGQTWEYLSGRWLNITQFVGTNAPSPRWDSAMAYDARDGYVLLFGGCGGTPRNGMCGNTFSDTWTFTSGAWKLLIQNKAPPPPPNIPPPPPTTAPSPGFAGSGLWGASMTYDPSFHGGSVVIFGGADGLLDYPPPPPGPNTPPETLTCSFYTWAWWQGAWTNESSSGTHPPAMYGAGFAGGLSDGNAVLFGGTNLTRYDTVQFPGSQSLLNVAGNVTGTTFNITWLFSSSGAWSSISGGTAAPPARYDFGMSYDPAGNGTILMYGGINSTGALLADAWQWIVLPPPPIGPPPPPGLWGPIRFPPAPFVGPRWNGAFTYDQPDNVFLLFGGESASGSALWDLETLGSIGWITGNSQPVRFPALPSGRYEPSLAFDDESQSVVMFGGESCGLEACALLGDTWTFFNGEWHAWSTGFAPSPRYGASMAYDPLDYDVYLFGGCGASCPMSDTWVYHQGAPTSPGTWTELFPPISPPGRYFATLTYDTSVQGLVLFGGCEGGLGACPADDTWTLTGLGTWNDLALDPSLSPPARFGAAATSIPGTFLVMFGGMGSAGLLTDTWVYGPLSGTAANPLGLGPLATARLGWTAVDTTVAPPGRVFGTFAYDAANRMLVLSGGCGSAGCPSPSPWYYTLITPKAPPPGQPPTPFEPWSALPSAPSAQWNDTPGSWYGAMSIWDPEGGSNGFVLTFGGRILNGQTVNATYQFAGFAWLGLSAVS